MSGSWRSDWWLGTISLSRGCFQMSQVCGLWSDDGLHGSYPRLGHNFLFADKPTGTSVMPSTSSLTGIALSLVWHSIGSWS
jgi:hypothetical protein